MVDKTKSDENVVNLNKVVYVIGVKKFRSYYEKRTGKSLNECVLSRFRNGKYNMSQRAIDVTNELLIQLTPWGGFILPEGKMPKKYDLLMESLKDKNNYDAVSELLEDIEFKFKVSKKKPCAEWVHYIGLRARVLWEKHEFLKALDAYNDACKKAKEGAPDLLNRYRTNQLNVKRELSKQQYVSGTISEVAYHTELRNILQEQKAIVAQCKSDQDKWHALMHCIRIASLLDDEEAFRSAFVKATEPGLLGKTQEELEKLAYHTMSPEHDEDGDFKNACVWIFRLEFLAS